MSSASEAWAGKIKPQTNASPSAFRVIAVAVPMKKNDIAREIENALIKLAPMIEAIMRCKSDESFRQIVEALVRPAVPTATALVEAHMLADAMNSVLQSKDYVTAKEIAEISRYSGTNPSAQPNRWKLAKQIFAINHGGTDYFPFFALDAANGYKPYPALADVLAIFGDAKGPWGAAFWFEAVNSYLGGGGSRRPCLALIRVLLSVRRRWKYHRLLMASKMPPRDRLRPSH